MYMEPIGGKTSVNIQQTVQNETNNTVHAESREGRAENGGQDMKGIAPDTKSKSPATETSTGADMQAAEKEKIKKAIEKMNAQLPNSEAKFGIHEATNRVMIKLVDKDTQEVIKEIPPEKTLDMIAKCMEMAGVLIDEKL